jgi:hypothetical protein
MNQKLTEAEKAERIADTKQHAKDGLITRREARRKIAEIQAK